MKMTQIDEGALRHDGTLNYAIGETSLGRILVAASDKGIRAILFGDAGETLTEDLRKAFPDANLAAGDDSHGDVVRQIEALVESPSSGLGLPLDVKGTAFQERVWQGLREIPAGETASYTDVAERIGSPDAVRAVAQACGANMLAVAVPCHRVVAADGSLSGYRWGVERKRALLDREAGA
jgi:AraC family transcriptional regulator of adaptative response/methylated-DNA-[protein]-cysteine methyltransferase